MQRPVPGPQSLRSMPGNVFGNPQTNANRTTSLGAARLQNGKLGTNVGWGFGMAMGSTQSLPSAQSRVNSGGLASFAQTIGGGQSQAPLDPSRIFALGEFLVRDDSELTQSPTETISSERGSQEHQLEPANPPILGTRDAPLDLLDQPDSLDQPDALQTQNFSTLAFPPLARSRIIDTNSPQSSEFPSLSSAPQQGGLQQQTSQAQSLWANPSLRATQHTPVQRLPQHQPQSSQPSHRSQAVSGQQHEVRDEASPFGQGSAEDFHFGSQSNSAPLPGMSQPQTGNIEEFPPLGGLGSGDVQHDQRATLLQNNAFAGGAGQGSRFSTGLSQTRNPMMSPESNSERGSLRLGGERIENRNTNSNGTQQQARSGFVTQQPIGQQLGHAQTFGGDAQIDSASSQAQSRPQASTAKRIADMTPEEKWGLPGLLAMIPSDSPDHNPLAVGQDLTVLGFDLNRTDSEPLYTTFGTPFDDASGNPPRPVIPEFSLPSSYAVTNVPPLQSKVEGFSDETLFFIFYQYPRDLMQEHAAAELFKRDWRWHKVLRQWMMKDQSSMAPQQISAKVERGFYIFFDVQSWSRQRRDMLLKYDDLDTRHATNLTHAGPSM